MSRARLLIPFLIFAAALAAHGRSLNYGFVFDEQLLIVDNPATRDLSHAGALFAEKFWPGPSRGIYYRPLVILSYAAGNQISFASPRVQHGINLLLHALASVLAYLLLLELIESRRAAAVAALLFALHPLHTESVAWVPGRTDVLAFGFMAAAWLAWISARRRSGRSRVIVAAGAAILYVAALLSKEIAVALPALVLTHDLLTKPREVRSRWTEYAGAAVLTVIFLGWRQWVLSGDGPAPAPDALAGISMGQHVVAVLSIFGRALRLCFVPGPWQCDYHHAALILGAPWWLTAGRVALVFLGLILAALLWRRRPVAAFVIVGIYLTVAPAAHLIGFPTLFAERFLYAPSFFACALLGLAFDSVSQRGAAGRKTALVIAGALGLLFMFQSITRSAPFRDDLTYWQSMTRQEPDLPLARNWLGIAYLKRDDLDRAGQSFEKALDLDPGFGPAAVNLLQVLVRQGEYEDAVKLGKVMIDRAAADPDLLVNLGQAYAGLKRWDQARDSWLHALDLDPQNFNAHVLLADFYLRRQRDFTAARRHLDAAAALHPGHPKVRQLMEAYQRETSP